MEMKAPTTTAHPHPPSGGVYPTGPPVAGGILNQAGNDSVGVQRSAKDKVLPQLKADGCIPHPGIQQQGLTPAHKVGTEPVPRTTSWRADLIGEHWGLTSTPHS